MPGKDTFRYMCNYSIVMSLLGYSQSKLAKLGSRLNELVYIDRFVSNDELTAVLGVSDEQIKQCMRDFQIAFEQVDRRDFNILSIRDAEYPELLKKIDRPPQILFLRGDIELLNTQCVSVVGSRAVSPEGVKRAQRVAIALSANNYTVVSGLAAGVDTAAHTATMKAGGRTIAVVGTPVNKYYPKENRALQDKVAEGHLLVSQFPFQQPTSPYNFPQRNFTMCGLSLATVIVEASETSGALYQATACIKEKRTLFIMKSLLENKSLKWPRKFVDQGAIVLDDIDTLLNCLHETKLKRSLPNDEDAQQLTFLKASSG